MSYIKSIIAERVAKELNDWDIVNLEIGLLTMVSNFIPESVDITLQSENGFIGVKPVVGKKVIFTRNVKFKI